MEELENNEKNDRREEIFSQTVRAGKRTYFFDVKETKAEEKYLTITESKRRFSNDQGRFFYEKHKIFLYKEDFQKFIDGLTTVIDFIETGKMPEIIEVVDSDNADQGDPDDIKFEDLDTESKG
jgi:glycogen synthase